MANLIKVTVDQKEIWMEVEGKLRKTDQLQKVSRDQGKSIEQAITTFQQISDTIQVYCDNLFATFKSMTPGTAPQKITAQFGLKLGGEGNVYVVKSTAEASLSITVEWQKNDN